MVLATSQQEFSDADHRLVAKADQSKQLAWDLSGLTTATTRTLTAPDASGTVMLTSAIGSTVQAYDADLALWAAITRASGFDTFATTPSSANLAALLTDHSGTWTPTVTSSGGTITTVGTKAGRWTKSGRLIVAQGNVTITTNGTGSGAVNFTLPFSPNAAEFAGSGYNAGSGAILSVLANNGDNKVRLFTASGGYPGSDGAVLVFTISYWL